MIAQVSSSSNCEDAIHVVEQDTLQEIVTVVSVRETSARYCHAKIVPGENCTGTIFETKIVPPGISL